MSGVFILAPVLTAAPIVLSAATAVAAAMGFSMATQQLDRLREHEVDPTVVCFDVGEARGLTQLVNERGAIVLTRDDCVICFRAGKGRTQVTVTGAVGASREALEALGQEVLGAIQQQYAYHAVMSDLKKRGFDKILEETEEDGTIRLHMRRWD